MLSFPPIHGPFPVGATTFATPVRPATHVGKAKLKTPRPSRPDSTNYALQLEEIAFTAYYPADISSNSSKGFDWFSRPLKDSLLGLATYAGISTWLLWPVVYLFGSFLKVPAYLNAPLLHPEKASGGKPEKQWPLVIFSHGLGGSRTAYSQYCSRLAASGKVVLALEHRDGTGLACRPKYREGNKNAVRSLVYLRETDVYWEDGEMPENFPKPLRGEQLAFRHHEIYIMYRAFQDLIQNNPDMEMENIDRVTFDKASWSSLTSSGSSIIKHNKDVFFTGHSFGAATAFSLLAIKPVENYTSIPVSKVIALDPWLDPLPSPGPVPYVTSDESEDGLVEAEASILSPLNDSALPVTKDSSKPKSPRTFVINSEAFTLWKEHYTRLEEIMAAWEPRGKRIATIIGSQHISFSDFSVLPILRKRHDITIFENIIKLSLAFLDDKLDEALKEEIPTTDMKIKVVGIRPDGRPKRKLIGDRGQVIIN